MFLPIYSADGFQVSESVLKFNDDYKERYKGDIMSEKDKCLICGNTLIYSSGIEGTNPTYRCGGPDCDYFLFDSEQKEIREQPTKDKKILKLRQVFEGRLKEKQKDENEKLDSLYKAMQKRKKYETLLAEASL